MSSTFGNYLKVSLFGESHGPAIGMTIDGLPAGVVIDEEKINKALKLRQGSEDISTKRREDDKVEFISGVFKRLTTGGPVTFLLRNHNVESSSYNEGQIRPSHADLTYAIKYNRFNDYRGGGSSSGRLTAPLVVLGEICKELLKFSDIAIGTHIKAIHGVFDRDFDQISDEINALNEKEFPTLDETKGIEMRNEILKAKEEGDSVGGILETAILNLPIGLGEPFFDSFESLLSHLLFSIGGIKGIEFGNGILMTSKKGSEVNDIPYFNNDKICYKTNNNGGILGGLTNSDPVIFKVFVKPTPSIYKTQESISLRTNQGTSLTLEGRYDPCIVQKVRYVVEALSAYAVIEMMMVEKSKEI